MGQGFLSSVTPLRRHAFMPLRRCAVTPLRLYAVTPLSLKPATLLRIHAEVHPAVLHQLFMCAGLRDCSLIEDNYPVGKGYISETMRYKDRCTSPNDLPKPAEDVILGLGIEGAGWFIEDENGSITVESPCKRYLLPFAPAELATVIKQVADHCIISFRQFVYQFMNTCL